MVLEILLQKKKILINKNNLANRAELLPVILFRGYENRLQHLNRKNFAMRYLNLIEKNNKSLLQ